MQVPPEILVHLINAAHAANQKKEFKSALQYCQRAIQFASDIPQAWYNLGIAQAGLGNRQEAKSAFEQVRLRAFNSADVQNSIGLAFANHNFDAEAEQCFLQALKLAPKHAFAYSNLGNLRTKQQRHIEAEKAFRQAIELAPKLSALYINLAAVLNTQERYAESESSCRHALALDPSSPNAWINLANALFALKRHEEAEQACRQSLAFDPALPEAWNTLGNVLNVRKLYDQALEANRKAIELAPQMQEAWANLICTLIALRQFDAAEVACHKMLEFAPQASVPWTNLGNIYANRKQYALAAEHFTKSFRLNPEETLLLGALMHTQMQICEWKDLDIQRKQLIHGIHNGKTISFPFFILGLLDDPSLQKKAVEAYVACHHPEQTKPSDIPQHSPHEKIRLGYYSSDFRTHPVSALIAEVFELHDKNRFELFAFSFGPESQDEMRQRVTTAFDLFIDVRDKTDREIVELSRQLEIDIAIDLGGFTEHNRFDIFAMRTAPVQISYLGYLGTLGGPYIDYLFADETLIPPRLQEHFTEKIVYLPSYQANDSKRKISPRHFSRAELGLPETSFVFCCFNNTYKISPEIFDCWMRILQHAKNSILFLYADNETAITNLKAQAVTRGVDANRLFFGEKLPVPEYLARYRVADLFLDTLPYNAGTTASDALWAGLPVLTCLGETFAGRIAASLLTALELPELIAQNREEYERIAVELALSTERLTAIKRKLASKRSTAALFDTPRFVKNIETAYTAMYGRSIGGLPSEHIHICENE